MVSRGSAQLPPPPRACLLASCLALCVVVCPAGRADVLAGRCASSTWFGPSQTPMSGHIQFAVNLTGTGASSAQFTIVRSDDTQLSLYASGTPMQGGAVYAITPVIGTFGWPNGEWEVTAQASTNSGPIFWGPTTFDIKSLNVTGLTATGSSSVLDSRFFVSVRPGAAQGLDLEGTWTDGYEIGLPMGNDPNLVDITYGLQPLSLGTQSSASATGVAPGAIVAAMTNVVPGLYYKTASGVERRPLYEPGNDGAATHATPLTISFLTKAGFGFTEARTGYLLVNARTTDVPPNSAVTDGEWAWRTPSGDLDVTSGGDHPDDSMAAYELTSPTLEFDEAGTYILAATFRDDHARPHDGAKEYCVPKSTTFQVPAATCYCDCEWAGLGEMVDGYLGQVWSNALSLSGCTFYADADKDSPDRGGAVDEGSTPSDLYDALEHDAVVYIATHGGIFDYDDGSGNQYAALSIGGECVTSCDIATEVDGCPSRLVYVACCYGMTDPLGPDVSVCATIAAEGADAVIGYDGTPSAGASGVYFDAVLWQCLTGAFVEPLSQVHYPPMGATEALGWARSETLRVYPSALWVQDVEVTPSQSDVGISPAFSL